MTNTVIFDIHRPNVAHTTIDCPQHFGLIEAVEALGYDIDDIDVFSAAVELLGLVVPSYLADNARPCACCTLIAAPVWMAAA